MGIIRFIVSFVFCFSVLLSVAQKKYDVEIQFGRQDEWKGNARGMSFDPPEDQPYLWVTVNATDAAVLFIEEFMEEKFVELFYNGESIDKLALKGSYAAGVKLLECQKSMREQDRDPFANPSKKKDPFAI